MIRQLPTAFALVIRSNCAPVITRLPQAWKNPAYRRARRLGHAPARPLGGGHLPPGPGPAGHPRPRASRLDTRRRRPTTPATPGTDVTDPIHRRAARTRLPPGADHPARRTRDRPLHHPDRAPGRAQPGILHLYPHHIPRIGIRILDRKRGNPLVRRRHLQRRVSAHIRAPQPKMLDVDIIAGREVLQRGTKLAGLAVPECRNSGDGPGAREVEQEDVELMLLQRGRQRENIAALRPVSVAHDDRRRAPQTREKQAVPRGAARDRKRQGRRMSHHDVHINVCRISRGMNDLVKNET